MPDYPLLLFFISFGTSISSHSTKSSYPTFSSSSYDENLRDTSSGRSEIASSVKAYGSVLSCPSSSVVADGLKAESPARECLDNPSF